MSGWTLGSADLVKVKGYTVYLWSGVLYPPRFLVDVQHTQHTSALTMPLTIINHSVSPTYGQSLIPRTIPAQKARLVN